MLIRYFEFDPQPRAHRDNDCIRGRRCKLYQKEGDEIFNIMNVDLQSGLNEKAITFETVSGFKKYLGYYMFILIELSKT